MNDNLSKSEAERQERAAASRRRRIKKVLIWLAVLAALAAAVYGLVVLSRKQAAGKPGAAYADQGAEHILPGEEHGAYNSNPPTSGWHYGQPAAWGIYGEELPDEQLIHNLEHGGIWISYRDSNDSGLVKQLQDIVKDYRIKVIMTPRAANDSSIAVAAWTHLLKLDQFDRGQILDFLKAYINRGPEQVPY